MTHAGYVQAIIWNGAGSDNLWSTGANWDSGTAPLSSQDVFINTGKIKEPQISSGVAAVGGVIRIGGNATTETLTVTGGSLATSTHLILGEGAGSNTTLSITGGTLTLGSLWAGNNGNGTVNMSGGTVTITSESLYIARFTTGMGYVHLNGGTINAPGIYMGGGVIDFTAGTLILSGDKTGIINTYIANGWITAYGGNGNVNVVYSGSNTTVSAAPVYKATNPNPANGAVGVSVHTDLSWDSNSGTASYNVYFGTDSTPDETEFIGNQTEKTCNPGLLKLASKYYWRVDSVDAYGAVITGDVWSFSTELIAGVWSNVDEYTYMWWAKGLRDSDQVFDIQTSGYGLSFDYNDFDIVTFAPIANPPAEADVLTQDNTIIDNLPAAHLRCMVESGGVQYSAVSTGGQTANCMLVESGKYFQRRWMEDINLESGAPAGQMNFEIAAWPDRISFILYFTPQVAISNGALLMELDLDDAFSTVMQSGIVKGLADAQGKKGFIFTSDYSAAQITCSGPTATCSMRFNYTGNWPAGEERSVALIVYPEARDSMSKIAEVAGAESSLITINAQQVNPSVYSLSSNYEKRYGWYKVTLRNDSCSGNDRIERVNFSVTNPGTQPRPVRLSFYKSGSVCGITGISAMLCDNQYNPLGVPVQLSKNWHSATPPKRYQGGWFRGLSMLTVPTQTTLNLNYTSVTAHWGGVAAASHAQLCLIGWGVNQLWDESAIGSWGESITYDPDINLNRSMVDDVRPLMVYSMNNNTPVKWNWTNNVGGADFLCCWNSSGVRQYNGRMKTYYKRYCPALTEVTYAGQGAGGAIELQCTTQLYRTDDIVRAVYRLRYDVTDNLPVSASPSGNVNRIAFFQLGADGYNDHNYEKMARGNSGGLIEEWAPIKGGNTYSRVSMPCTGLLPWFSLHEANSRDTSLYGAWANRGLVIRSYQARLGGVDDNTPYASVYGTTNGGINSANIELSVPSNISQLLPGDYLETELVYIVMPQFAADYYGPNANLAAALSSMENTWQMIYREVLGNDLEVNMIRGKLLKTYPLHVKACNGSEFEITGGLGYVPMTFEELCSHSGYTLEEYRNQSWIAVNQSVQGNDFWQVDFDPKNLTWSRTYTINLDNPSDAKVTRRFRLTGPCVLDPSADLNCDGRVDVEDLYIFVLEWFCQSPCSDGISDLNYDSYVNLLDFQFLASNWLVETE
jgi:hypothetical protein